MLTEALKLIESLFLQDYSHYKNIIALLPVQCVPGLGCYSINIKIALAVYYFQGWSQSSMAA